MERDFSFTITVNTTTGEIGTWDTPDFARQEQELRDQYSARAIVMFVASNEQGMVMAQIREGQVVTLEDIELLYAHLNAMLADYSTPDGMSYQDARLMAAFLNRAILSNVMRGTLQQYAAEQAQQMQAQLAAQAIVAQGAKGLPQAAGPAQVRKSGLIQVGR